MFLHRPDESKRALAVPQASHAWLAWQLAEHWGNRHFNRPRPRAEVLAAVMLHDAGWTDFDAAPGIDKNGRPRTFDRMPIEIHLDIWRRSVSRAAQHSRYAALLVANHFADMAEVKTADLLARGDTGGARLAESFRAEMGRQQASWTEALATDARYRESIDGWRLQSNADILTLADKVSVYLCGSLASDFEVVAPTDKGEWRTVKIAAVDRNRWRVDPWPMEGNTVRLQCEGRVLAGVTYDSDEEFHTALRRSPVERLNFTFVRASAIG
jgi:hypothetical protein